MIKLLEKYNRASLMVTISVIVVAGFIYYFTISYILTGQVDKDLVVEENEIFDYVKLNGKLPQVFKSEDLKIQFIPVNIDTVQRLLYDTRYYNEKEHEQEVGRRLISSVKVKKQNYRIEITESKVETEYLIRVIFGITLLIIFSLLLILLIFNRVLMRKLWQPFYELLQQIKKFNLADHSKITRLDTQIEEFHDLNIEVSAMSERVQQDYQLLKNFVENAAHELMTPLAVITNKLDNLVQDSSISNSQGEIIGEVYDTVGRLKQLNKSMLLLARIENKMIPEREKIDLEKEITEKVNDFQELAVPRHISISAHINPLTITASRDLISILLNNLILNAIRHNYDSGSVNIQLEDKQLTVCNTGVPNALDAGNIFQRFNKSAESEGTGLGLTLVKEICDGHGFGIAYHYSENRHCFTISF